MIHPDRGSWFRKTLAAIPLVLYAGCTAAVDPPESRVETVVETIHGVQVSDPYRWLEDQDAPETRAWIEKQNAYTNLFLKSYSGRGQLEKRFTELLRIDEMGAPRVRNGRYFYSRDRADQELRVYYYRDGQAGEEKLLIDPHGLSEDKRTSVTLMEVSDDATLFAYGIRQGGEDELEVHWRQVESGEELPDVLPRKRYRGISLLPDKSGFYYSLNDGKDQHHVFYHQMGTDPASDRKVWGDAFQTGDIIGGSLSEDGRYLLLTANHGWSHTELYVQDLQRGGAPRSVSGNRRANFSGSMGGGKLFVRTNWEAPHYRVFAVDPSDPEGEWKEIVKEDPAAVLTGMSLVGGKLFLNYLRDVRTEIKIVSASGEALGQLRLPALGTASTPSGEWSSNEAFYTFSSFHIPSTIYRYEVDSGAQDVWYQSPVEIDGDSIQVSQVRFPSKDGTEIPMFLVHKRGLKTDGSNPAYLTGYGGFNISRRPGFSAAALVWVESGGVYALPNLRGGGEFGEQWHRAGMLEKKQNVFDDFIAAAEWLIDRGYTSPRKLAIAGGSNGGLLVGAALTQRPDLFQAVICSVPLLDMVRYHQFLVASFWVPEYGSSEDPDQFRFLYEYSPYHRVKPGTDYPAVLFDTGDSDTRVSPLHARKMTALLQASQAGDRPVLLRYDTKGGHSGGTPTSKQIENLTDRFSFLYWQLGVLEGMQP